MSLHHHYRHHCCLPVLVSVLVQAAVQQCTVSTSTPGTLPTLSAAVLLAFAGYLTKAAASANVVLSWIISLLAARNVILDLLAEIFYHSSRCFEATAELSGGSTHRPSGAVLTRASRPHSNPVCVAPVAAGPRRRPDKPERGRFNHQHGRPSNAGGGRTMASFFLSSFRVFLRCQHRPGVSGGPDLIALGPSPPPFSGMSPSQCYEESALPSNSTSACPPPSPKETWIRIASLVRARSGFPERFRKGDV